MSSISHFRMVHTNGSSDNSTTPGQTPHQGRKNIHRTRYREWADYGAPPLLPFAHL